MTTISVFTAFKLGRRLLSCERDSAHSYTLIADGVRSSMSVEDAETLGKRGWALDRRWSRKTADGRMKPGLIFSIQTPETLDTIGVTDDGYFIYVEADEERISLTEDEVQMLAFVLRQIRDDVRSLYHAGQRSAGPPELTVAQGLRGLIRMPGTLPGDPDEWM
jgi:hypothetical protein